MCSYIHIPLSCFWLPLNIFVVQGPREKCLGERTWSSRLTPSGSVIKSNFKSLPFIKKSNIPYHQKLSTLTFYAVSNIHNTWKHFIQSWHLLCSNLSIVPFIVLSTPEAAGQVGWAFVHWSLVQTFALNDFLTEIHTSVLFWDFLLFVQWVCHHHRLQHMLLMPHSRSQITWSRRISCISIGTIAEPLQHCVFAQNAFNAISKVQAVPPVTLPPVNSHSKTILRYHKPLSPSASSIIRHL